MWFRIGLTAFLLQLFSAVSFALITGGEKQPVRDPGWPSGAAEIFNHTSRIAYWEGPPFGGGQYHAEYRGDTQTFNTLLSEFAKLEVATRRVILNDGVGRSFWLNPNDEQEKRDKSQIDWRFMVWVPNNWDRLAKLPPDLNPTDPAANPHGPPIEIEIFTGGNLNGADIVLPDGIEVIDNRLAAHGFSKDDGVVLQGTLRDLELGDPMAGKVELQTIATKKTGGYDYSVSEQTSTDTAGNWALKNVPAGWYRVVATAEGYVPRVAGHLKTDGQPSWQSYAAKLAKPGDVRGTVSDEQGEPLAGVNVSLSDVSASGATKYGSPQPFAAETNQQGEFLIAGAPLGAAKVRVHKQGYTGPGLGEAIKIPASDLRLTMSAAADLKVIVLFVTEEIPSDYLVNIEPEGGAVVGSWGGSAKIDDQNQVVFRNVPPGKYVVVGHPNPHSAPEKTTPLTVELTGGASETVTIKAR